MVKEEAGLYFYRAMRNGDQIKNFLNPFFGSMKLCQIEKMHLKNYIRESYENDISSYNANSTVNLFKTIIRQAIDDDYETDERILLVKNPKHTAKDPVFWSVDQMKYFLDAAIESKSFILWKFALFTGLRACEVTALKWDCIFMNLQSGGHTGFILVKRSRAQKAKAVAEKKKRREANDSDGSRSSGDSFKFRRK